jgi:hypothetical protein
MGKDQELVRCSFKLLLFSALLCLISVGLSLVAGRAVAEDIAAGQAVVAEGFSCSIEASTSRLSCQAIEGHDLAAARYFNLEAPDRVVVDVPDFEINRSEVYSLVDSPVIQRVRSAKRGEGVRIVLDLKGPATATEYRSDDKRIFSLELNLVETQPPSPNNGAPPIRLKSESDDESAGGEDDEASKAQAQQDAMPTAVPSNLSVVPPDNKAMDLKIEQETLPKDGLLKFSVDSTFLSFEPGDRPLRDIQVTNKTSQDIFLRTFVQRVQEVNSPQERYEDTKTLISSPRRFLLPALASRSVRVVLAGQAPEEGEEVYRLILSPEALPEGEAEAVGQVNEQEVRFQVIAALGVTITLPSVEAKGVVRIEPGLNKVDLINSGTRAVLVQNCSSCPLEREVCTSSGKKLLYPNRPWSVPVKGSGVMSCEFSMGKQKQKVSSFYGAQESR